MSPRPRLLDLEAGRLPAPRWGLARIEREPEGFSGRRTGCVYWYGGGRQIKRHYLPEDDEGEFTGMVDTLDEANVSIFGEPFVKIFNALLCWEVPSLDSDFRP